MPLDSIIITPVAYSQPKNTIEFGINELVLKCYESESMRECNACVFDVQRSDDGRIYFTNVGWTKEGFRLISSAMPEIQAVEFVSRFITLLYPEVNEPSFVPVPLDEILKKYEDGL